MASKTPSLKFKIKAFAEKGALNKKIIEILSKDLFWILLISAVIRLLYYSVLQIAEMPDSFSYLCYNRNIFKGEVDALRTPVYPYFIECLRIIDRQNLIRNITIAQSLISFFTIILFYRITCFAFKTRKVINISTLLYAVMLPIISFDKLILTESLSVSCTVVFIYFVLDYLQKPTTFKSVILTLFILFSIMMRPAFIGLFLITVLFWIVRFIVHKKERKICFAGLVTTLFVVLLLQGYSNLNNRDNDYYGISTVSNINQLDIIISSNMYMNGDDTALSNLIRRDFSKPLTPNEHWVPLMQIIHQEKPKRISNFIANCIKRQPKAFVRRIFETADTLQTSNILPNYTFAKKGFLSDLLINIESKTFFITFNKVYIFIFFDFIFIVLTSIKAKQIPWFRSILWLINTGQLAIAIIGAQSDYQRLVIIIIPCLLINIFYYIDTIYYTIDKQKLNNYTKTF